MRLYIICQLCTWKTPQNKYANIFIFCDVMHNPGGAVSVWGMTYNFLLKVLAMMAIGSVIHIFK